MYDNDFDSSSTKVTQYLIPANVTVRFEIWEGFGWQELKYCAIALIFGFLLFYIVGMFYKTEVYNINEMPLEMKLGLQEDEFTSIDGDIVTKKVRIVSDGIRFLFIIIPTAITYFCVKRDRSTNMSLIDNLRHMREFQKSQKLYLYKYGSGSEG